MPLKWSQVTSRLRLGRFNISNAARLISASGDPLALVLNDSVDMLAALGELQQQFAAST